VDRLLLKSDKERRQNGHSGSACHPDFLGDGGRKISSSRQPRQSQRKVKNKIQTRTAGMGQDVKFLLTKCEDLRVVGGEKERSRGRI
jgi:hypothetical protein